MYRSLLAGAVLFQAYNEPFSLNSGSRPPHVLKEYLKEYNFARNDPLDESGVASWPYILPPEDVRYLTNFTVYNFQISEDRQLPVFGPYAEWLVEDGKSLAAENNCPIVWDFDSSQVSCILETMMMVRVHNHHQCNFVNGDGKIGHGRYSPDDESPSMKQEIPGASRNATVIMFGVFRLEEISMPVVVKDSSNTKLIANPVLCPEISEDNTSETTRLWMNIDIQNILDILFRNCNLPNHYNGYPGAPPEFQIFSFILRKYFNLQFKTEAFEIGYTEQPFEEFMHSAAIFHNGGSLKTPHRYGFGILEPYRARELSFVRIS